MFQRVRRKRNSITSINLASMVTIASTLKVSKHCLEEYCSNAMFTTTRGRRQSSSHKRTIWRDGGQKSLFPSLLTSNDDDKNSVDRTCRPLGLSKSTEVKKIDLFPHIDMWRSNCRSVLVFSLFFASYSSDRTITWQASLSKIISRKTFQSWNR